MDTRLKSLVTLAGLAVLLLVAGVWGWAAMTEPFPEQADPPVCVDHEFGKGDRLARRDVTVSVWNAGSRSGLAGLTMGLLTDAGFGEGNVGDAPRKVSVTRVQVWTDLRRSHPAVRLIRAHFRPAPKVVDRSPGAAGVLVVVGDGFRDLAKGRAQVPVRGDVEVCGPPAVS